MSVTVMVTVEVLEPSAGMLVGLAEIVMVFGAGFCLIGPAGGVPATPPVVPVPAPLDSWAMTLQLPTVVEAVYVTVATPLALVVARAEFSVPQEPVALGVRVNSTGSLGIGAVPVATEVVTVAVSVTVVLPSAGIPPAV
jgi:hypothetical protein